MIIVCGFLSHKLVSCGLLQVYGKPHPFVYSDPTKRIARTWCVVHTRPRSTFGKQAGSLGSIPSVRDALFMMSCFLFALQCNVAESCHSASVAADGETFHPLLNLCPLDRTGTGNIIRMWCTSESGASSVFMLQETPHPFVDPNRRTTRTWCMGYTRPRWVVKSEFSTGSLGSIPSVRDALFMMLCFLFEL
jgi:hypothetical protein